MSALALLVCPVCSGRLGERSNGVGCAHCDLHYGLADGVYLLGPTLPVNGTRRQRTTARVAPLDPGADVIRSAAEEPATRPPDDPSRTGWRFLLDLRPGARILVLGPAGDADPAALAPFAARMIVLDRDLEQLQATRRQVIDAGWPHVVFARVVDPLRMPVPNASVDLAIVPGIAEWLVAVGGRDRVRAERGGELLHELRRVLAPGGQAWIGAGNRLNALGLLAPLGRTGIRYTAGALRGAAEGAGFRSCRLFAPLPARRKFFQIVDLERADAMNFCADPYRTRGPALRVLVRAFELANAGGRLERRLYPYVPDFGGVLSVDSTAGSFAERLVEHVGGGRMRLERYFVRPKGVAVLVAKGPDDGRVIRLPLAGNAEQTCRRHHAALEALANDTRLPLTLRALFPVPIGAGDLAGQPYFVESLLAGESGRSYYARRIGRYERAIAQAADRLADLRHASQAHVTIDEPEFERLCGGWLRELRVLVAEEQRGTLDRLDRELRDALVGTVLPLGWYHGDYDFANLLYDSGDRLAGIIDFELFDARGLPLVDLMVLLARRAVRRRDIGFGTLFLSTILPRALPPFEARLLDREVESAGADQRLYRALALCCWLEHVRLRRDSWLLRSPSWRRDNVDKVLGWLASAH